MRVLVTGGAGRIGRALREGLRGRCALRSLDVAPIEPVEGEEARAVDIRDLDALTAAAAGCDAIVHLAGIPREADHETLLDVNLRGTYHAFEAAVRAGCGRVVFASTNHVTGFYPSETVVTPDVPVRPDSLYGASKAYGEALGRLYHDRHGLAVAALRIGSFLPAPSLPRHAHTWISPRDMTELVWRCLVTPDLGWLIVYGGSANREAYWDDAAARRRIDYRPTDSADRLAGGEGDRYQGGPHVGATTSQEEYRQ
jgi:uronate dehydrogenase